jgi:crotonobetainyl-CoA:carnitine CoA-transferase CaiB-like acyl-CoA transferase
MIARLASWADAQITAIAAMTKSSAIAALSGAELLGIRGQRGNASCRFYKAKDGHVALNLARPDDVALLPALFGETDFEIDDAMAKESAADLVARGRTLGLAIAHLDERPVSPACMTMSQGLAATKTPDRLTVFDLSALWAGPLAAHLLSLSGATVIKAESTGRPDAMRLGDPELFERLNDRKVQRAFDLHTSAGRDAVIALIHDADIVIEAARPRALLQLGIDAHALVAEIPGLVWVTITGHGIVGDAANWIGFGDDTGVAGGLSAAQYRATGKIGLVGDAIGDPLTGIYAARMALEQRACGVGTRLALSMSGVVAKALSETDAPFAPC